MKKEYVASNIGEIRDEYKKKLITANEMYNQALIIYENCEDRESSIFQMMWIYYEFLKKSENNVKNWFKTLTKIDEIINDYQGDKSIFFDSIKFSFKKLIESNPRIDEFIIDEYQFINLNEFLPHLKEQYYVTKLYERIRNNNYKILEIEKELKVLIEFKSSQLTNIISRIISQKKNNRNSIIDLFDILGNDWFVGDCSNLLHSHLIKYSKHDSIKSNVDAPITLLEKFVKIYLESILTFYDKFNDPIFDENRARAVMVAVDKILLKHNDYISLRHNYSKLLFELKEYEKGRKVYYPYIKKHVNHYWAWELLGDLCENLAEQGYCYIRSLSCMPSQIQKKNLLIKSLPYLVEYNLLDNAIAEINNYVDFCKTNKHHIDNKLGNWINKLDMTDNRNIDYNLYKIYFDPTEKLIYSDTEYIDIFITYINPEKRVINFNLSSGNFGYLFVPEKFDIEKIELYSTLNVKIYSRDESYYERKYALLDIDYEVNNNALVNEFLQSFRSEIMKYKNDKFAFTRDGAYISKDVLESKNLLSLESFVYGWREFYFNDDEDEDKNENYEISGLKVFKYNSKKKSSGWIVIKIDDINVI